ncbi:LamG-like jellyroll fold domain-containing protein [Marinoscillum pacificum]|uniref:LamG-like jellyroll fold domain-containing protein n=1 Tax=Marinoscillum pacificum TaxID=392723 RepID=UPI0021579C4A|nr:LamG-like jellyroll fold domain-containing protein [Marinoscillum pacificum]
MTNSRLDTPRGTKVLKSILFLSSFLFFSWTGLGQNTSLQFDGAALNEQDYVDLPSLVASSTGTPFTYEAWIKIDASAPTGWRTILEFGNDAPYFGLNNGINLQIAATSPTYEITPDVWTHVAAAFDGSSLHLVVDGVEQASETALPAGNGNSAGIGYHDGDNGFMGWIDEVRVWDVYRDPSMISSQMNEELSGTEPNLVAYYNFNDGTGSTLTDLTPNNHLGTLLNGDNSTPADGELNGPIWSSDVPPVSSFNTALDFDGINNYVVSGSNLGITGGNPITLEFWYKNGTNSGITHPVTLGAQSPSSGFGFFLTDNDLYFYGESDDYNTGYSFADNDWHHLAVTYDATVVRTYVDGLETPTSGIAKTLTIGDGPIYIGSKMDLSSFIQGSIDEVRIWNKAHTQSQIDALKEQQLRGDEYGLITYYAFEDGIGSSVLTDLSTNANDGTLNNMEPSSDWVDGPGIVAAETCGVLTIIPVSTDNTLCVGGNGLLDFTSTTSTGEPGSYTYKFYEGAVPDPGMLLQEDQILDGSIGFSYSGLSAGIYTLEVINDDNFCHDVVSAVISDNSAFPEATVTITDNSYCIGGNGELFIQAATSGTGSGNYKGVVYEGIGTGGTIIQDSTSFIGDTGYSVTGLVANDYTIVIKEDATGCIDVFNYTISDNPDAPAITPGSVTITDDSGSGGSIDATGAISGGSGDYSYSWHEGISTAGTVVGTGISVTGLSAGDYTLEVADNISGCVSIAHTFNIQDLTAPPPAAPINLVGYYRDATSIELAWTDVAADNTDYLVEWSTSYESFDANIVSSSVVGTGDAVGAVVGVGPDQGYFFRVTATNGFEDASSQSVIEFATTEDFPGYALSFDGDDYTNAPESLGNLSTLTISAWVYPRSFGASNSWAYWRGNTTVDQTGGEIYFTPAGLVGYGESDVTYQGITSSTALPLNEWSHVAVVKTGGAAQLYINGLADGDAGVINGTPPNGEISLGARVRTSTDGYFDGLIDEVRVWADSVKTDFSDRFTSLMGNEPKLAVYYTMDENGGSKLVDRSVNSIDADIIGASFVSSDAGLPIIYNATNVTISGFTPNVEVPAGAVDMIVDVSTDPNFGSFLPSGQDISIGTSGGVDVSVSLNTSSQYYYRVKADFGGTQSGYAVSNSFMVGPGNAFDFPGTSKYVTVTDSDELDLNGDATIEFWAYWNGFDESPHAIISKFVDSNSRNYRIYINPEGALVIHGVNENVTGFGLAELAWTHIAIVQSGTDFLLYVNGELKETISDTWGTLNSSELWIGADYVNNEWDGQLDEIRVWNYARSEAEIIEFAEKTVSGSDPGLVAYYRFDEVSGTALPDLSMYGNDGVFQNSAGTEWVASSAMAIPFNVELSYNSFLSDPSSESTLSINVVFNREVASLTEGDFTVTNATLTNLSTSDNISFTADISPTSTGVVQVSLASDVVQDLNSNFNGASNVLEYNYSETTSYTISTSSYGYETLSSPTTLSEVLNDDATSTAQTIGFDFEFFGQTYSSVYVNSNGWVSFIETNDASAYSGEKFPDPEGSTVDSEGSANGLIAGYWSDLDGSSAPADGYQVELIGTAPNRIYVIQYKDVPHLNNASNLVNFQIKLFETTNEVEIHCESCYTSEEAFTQGLENQDGTDYITVLGRNQSVFSIYNDAVRFTPVPPPSIANVEKSLAVWLKADAGVVGSTNASAWTDQSGNTNDASQVTTLNQPAIESSAINYNQALSFNGVDQYMEVPFDISPSINPDITGFVVFNSNDEGTTHRKLFGHDPLAGGSYQRSIGLDSRSGTNLSYFAAGGTPVGSIIEIGADTTYLLNFEYTAGSFASYVNGSVTGSTIVSNPDGDSFFTIGALNANGEYWDGNIAEVIFYDELLGSVEREKIQSYLAIKYGIPLVTNYLDSDGNVIFNNSGSYTNGITAIGRDNVSLLDQKQSISSTEKILTVAVDAIALDNTSNSGTLIDKNFLFLGHDSGPMDYGSVITTGNPAGVDERMATVWQAVETGQTGTLSLSLDLNGLGYPGVDASNYILMVDNDGVWSDAVTFGGASYNSGVVTFDGVTIDNGQLVTLGYSSQTAVTEDFETASGGQSLYTLPTGDYHAANVVSDGIANSGSIGLRLSYGYGTITTPLIDGNSDFSFFVAATGDGESHYTVEKSVNGGAYIVVSTPTATSATFTEQTVSLAEGAGSAVRIRITFNDQISDQELVVDDFTFKEYTGGSTFPPQVTQLNHYGNVTDVTVDLTVDIGTDFYYVISTSATTPTPTQIKSELDGDGVGAVVAGNYGQLTGTSNLSIGGLSSGVTYHIYWYGEEALNVTNVTSVYSDSFSTIIPSQVTISSESVTGGELSVNSTDNLLYKLRMDIADGDADMVGFVLFPNDSTDNYSQSDFAQFDIYESINADDFGGATHITSTFFTDGHPELPDGAIGHLWNTTYLAGDVVYLYVTADMAGVVSEGASFNFELPDTENNFGFEGEVTKIDGGLTTGSTFTLTNTESNELTIEFYEDGTTQNNNTIITGFVSDADATVEISLDYGTTFTAIAVDGGSWSYDLSSDPSYYGDAYYDIQIVATDLSLNEAYYYGGIMLTSVEVVLEDFETMDATTYSGTTTLPSGDWELVGAIGSNNHPYNGAVSLGLLDENTASAISPLIDAEYSFSFQYYSNGAEFTILQSIDEGVFETVETINESSGTYQYYEYNPYYSGSSVRYMIQMNDLNSSDTLFIDDFSFVAYDTSPGITIYSPYGGEEVPLDYEYYIYWNEQNIDAADVVTVELSIDGGSSFPYTLISDLSENLMGQFYWTPTGSEFITESAVIKISAAGTETFSDQFFIVDGFGGLNSLYESFDFGLLDTEESSVELYSGTWNTQGIISAFSVNASYPLNGEGDAALMNVAEGNYLETPYVYGATEFAFQHRAVNGGTTGFLFDIYLSDDEGATFSILETSGGGTSLTYEEFYHSFSEPYTGPIRIVYNSSADDSGLIDEFSTDGILGAEMDFTVEDFESVSLQAYDGPTILPSGEWDFTNAYGNDGPNNSGSFSMGVTVGTGEIITPYLIGGTEMYFQYYGTDVDFSVYEQQNEGTFELVTSLSATSGFYEEFYYYTSETDSVRLKIVPESGTSNLIVDDFQFAPVPKFVSNQTVVESSVFFDNNKVTITFSDNVYATNAGSGLLEISDFIITSNPSDLNAQITSVTQTGAGDPLVTLLLDQDYFPTGAETIGISFAANSIFDTNGEPVADSTVTFTLKDVVAPDVTVNTNDGYVNSTILTGTIEADAVLDIELTASRLTGVGVVVGTDWSFDLTTHPDWDVNGGNYPLFKITATDTAGNSTDLSEALVVDTTPPAAPTVNTLSSTTSFFTLTGTYDEVGTNYLRVSLDGIVWDTLVVDGGSWSNDYTGVANGTYDVQVEASDYAGNVATDASTNELVVSVNYPVITGLSEITIVENTTEVTAYSADQTVSWTLGGDDAALFTLGVDGTLSFTNAPDFESAGDLNADNVHNLQVIATNLEGNNDTIFAVVNVADANDNAPVILDPGAISIDERSLVGSLVVDCEFTDIDTVTSINTWSIISGNLDINSNTELPFGINSTGQIVVVDSTDLDFELAPSFTLEVVLNDGLFNDTLLLNINLNQVIADVTAPIITADDLLTNDISPELIGTIDDTDASVSITVDGAAYDAVNNADGTWTLAQATIGDLAEGVYSFNVVATDSVGNASTVTATLEIDLTAPFVTINTVVTEDDSPELSGSIDDVNADVSVSVNSQSYTATNNEDGTWTLASGIIEGLPVNVYDVIVQALDSAGNTGTDGTSSELEILPGAPIAYDAEEVDFLSFRAYWSSRGGVANYEFDVATDITFVNRATGFNNLSLTDTTVQVTGLDYNTTYYYRARAVYEGGAVSPYSNVITVSTLSDANTTADSLALLEIYEALSGSEWTTNNWTQTLPLSDWTGVSMTGTRVTGLDLSGNNLKGDFPAITSGLEALTALNISNNEITSIGDISHFAALETIDISDNRMAFGSIENVFFAGIAATVSPQKALLTRLRTLEEIGTTYTVDRTVSGSDNVYSWTKNGVAIAQTTGSFDISIANFSADGTYVAKVTSNVIPLVELTTAPVVLRVSSLERDSTSLMTIYESLDGANSSLSDWTTLSIRDWPEVEVTNNRVTALNAPEAGLTGSIPEDITDIRGLVSVDLAGNAIDGLPNLEGYLPNLTSFNVSGNKLTFEDLEENTGVTGIDYSDQQAFGEVVSEVIPKGSEYTISMPVGGTSNAYEWMLMSPVDTAVVEGEVSSELQIPSIDYESMGTYTLQVTNDLVPGLVLKGEPQQILASANLNFTALDQGGDPFDTGEAYALQISDNPEGYDTLQTVRGTNNAFAFESLILGDYLIAVAPDFDNEFLTTYYESTDLWTEADVMMLRSDTTEELAMVVTPGSAGKGGPDGGKVNGNVESNFGATTSGRIEARRKVKRAACSVRRFVPKGRTDQEDGEFVLYAYIESDDEGQFEFTELEDGRYRFNIEYPGIPMDEDSYVEFVIGEGGIEDEVLVLQATVTEDGIVVEKIERLGFYRKYFKDLSVYPNPADNYLHISYGKLMSSNVTVRLIDLNGNVIKEQQIEKGYDKELDFDVSEITNGIYLINFVDTSLGSERITSFKVFVKH